MTPQDHNEERLKQLSLVNPFVHRLLSFLREPDCTPSQAMEAYKATVVALAESNKHYRQR